MRTYSTKNEAIKREIVEPLGEHAGDHDIDAIADEIIISGGTAVHPQFSIDPAADFWAIVARNEK